MLRERSRTDEELEALRVLGGVTRQVFADGGCIGRNPSSIGGAWGWAWVDGHGQALCYDSGRLSACPAFPAVGNNTMEFTAVMQALKHLPPGWCGQVLTDSAWAIGAYTQIWDIRAIPDWFLGMGRETLERLGEVEFVLLDGHPTRAQLASGVGKRGNPVSEHNVFCDGLCAEVARKALADSGWQPS